MKRIYQWVIYNVSIVLQETFDIYMYTLRETSKQNIEHVDPVSILSFVRDIGACR